MLHSLDACKSTFIITLLFIDNAREQRKVPYRKDNHDVKRKLEDFCERRVENTSRNNINIKKAERG